MKTLNSHPRSLRNQRVPAILDDLADLHHHGVHVLDSFVDQFHLDSIFEELILEELLLEDFVLEELVLEELVLEELVLEELVLEELGPDIDLQCTRQNMASPLPAGYFVHVNVTLVEAVLVASLRPHRCPTGWCCRRH